MNLKSCGTFEEFKTSNNIFLILENDTRIDSKDATSYSVVSKREL
jgi:hypothetical protein